MAPLRNHAQNCRCGVCLKAAAQGECAKLFDKQQSLWNSLYRETVEKMTPIIAGVLVSLDSDQQMELAEGMQADLKKASERMKNPQEDR